MSDWLNPTLGILGDLGAGIFGLVSQNLTNDTNARIAEQTNQANQANVNETNATNLQIAQGNQALQQQNLDWQKAQWEQVKNREDSAYQRAVADATTAGLSPLAVSSGASTSSAPATSAPENNFQAQSFQKQSYQLQAPLIESAVIADLSKNLNTISQNVKETQRNQEAIDRWSKEFKSKSENDLVNNAYTREQTRAIKSQNDYDDDHPYNRSKNYKYDVIADVLKSFGKNFGINSPKDLVGKASSALGDFTQNVSDVISTNNGTSSSSTSRLASQQVSKANSLSDAISQAKSMRGASVNEKYGAVMSWMRDHGYSESEIQQYIRNNRSLFN